MSIEPPRQVSEFTVIEPSGRRLHIRHLTRAQKMRAAVVTGALVIVSLALWAIQLAPIWLAIGGWLK
ncbi:MAG: hypothetical protein WB868_16290 [Xanthobacteraceae bacterium]